ncbi:hypothetical protein [Streptomyces zaomyceticus]|uniref:hypothetical protein n=1 Tax=Streptomyces zaomyceticus TaxID=68286 RepID=UPI002F909896
MNNRVSVIIITVLLAVIFGLGTGIVIDKLGASSLTAVTAGGGAFLAAATLGIAIAAFLFPPSRNERPPASS